MKKKNLDKRVCFNCNILEDEKHVLLNCPLYEDLRHALFIDILCHNDMFFKLSDEEKFIYMFKIPIFVILLPKPAKTF